MWGAVIRAKLLYGLESAQINDARLKRIDAFKLRGIRQILGILATHGQALRGEERTNTNSEVYRWASQAAYPASSRKEVRPVSAVYNDRRMRLYCKLLTELWGTPAQLLSMHQDTLRPPHGHRRRAGHPKTSGA